MIALRGENGGVLLPVRARAGARKSGVRGVQDGRLKVSVTQAAEKGKANAAIIAVLARALGLRKSQIELATGHTASMKQFLIRGASISELERRLAAALADAE